MGKIRLDRFLSEQNIASRSQIKTILKKNNICVNGEKVIDGAVKVSPDSDEITVDGKIISYVKFIYIILNKPAGFITATRDNRDRTVIDLIGDEVPHKAKLSPVGRLDKDTTGLLLLTDDGELNHRLLSPKCHVSKKYIAILDKKIDDFDDAVIKFHNGVDIGDKKDTLPAVLEKADIDNGYFITITEGRYHQIKRMFKTLNRFVAALKRVSMGSIVLDDNLEEGKYRFLTEEEICKLKNYNTKE